MEDVGSVSGKITKVERMLTLITSTTWSDSEKVASLTMTTLGRGIHACKSFTERLATSRRSRAFAMRVLNTNASGYLTARRGSAGNALYVAEFSVGIFTEKSLIPSSQRRFSKRIKKKGGKTLRRARRRPLARRCTPRKTVRRNEIREGEREEKERERKRWYGRVAA